MKTKACLLFTFILFYNLCSIQLYAQAAEKTISATKPKDTLVSSFSINFIPLPDKKRSASIYLVNEFQLNILAGSSDEIRVGQIAGLFNKVNGSIKSLQLAGLGNVVSDSVKGVQLGGLFNTTRKKTKGVQIGGLCNYSSILEGAQIGGLTNVIKQSSRGSQIAGLSNHADSIKGLQIGGLINTATKRADGGQIAGIGNFADTLNGFQIGGIVNTAKIANGFQLAGLVNCAKKINGVQLSLLNFSDSCSGIPIGFFSYVKNGYHKFEFTLDELLLTTVGFSVGTKQLHNIFFTGIKFSENPSLWTYGYGLGSTRTITPKLNFNCDLTSQQLQGLNNNKYIRLNLLNKLFFGVEYNAFSKFSIGAGPTYNVIISDVTSKDYTNTYSSVVPYSFYNHTHGDFNIKMWVGVKLSLKFL